jgi:YebC/PmpR family DNA-binding regulatory protein
MAVKQGGSADPNANRQLADLMKQARANSVPVENIQRAIKRASESSDGGGSDDFKERTFEAYGHGGASIVISVLTDNDNRANSDVRSAVNRRNGKMAEQGSVLFMYDRKGVLDINAVLDEEAVLEAAIGAGIDDYELQSGDEEGTSKILTDPKEVSAMLDAIKDGLGITDEADNIKMSLAYVSKASVEVSEEDFEKNMNMIDALEELEDVDSVEHNMSN